MKKRTLYYAMVAILLCSCSGKKETTGTVNANTKRSEATDTTKGEETSLRPLNDIRFAGWTEKEWLDNEYIRTLRRYLDAYNQGKVTNEELNPYRKLVKSKFVVARIEKFLLGGAFISITFVDSPEKVFRAWVYSDVDEETEKVSNYRVKVVKYETDIEMTKEELQQLMKEHPEYKAW